jgi:hypothetical protein
MPAPQKTCPSTMSYSTDGDDQTARWQPLGVPGPLNMDSERISSGSQPFKVIKPRGC